MKKLLLLLLTAATVAAVAGFAGCTNGQTGGGDNTMHRERSSEEHAQAEEDIAEDYELTPPEMQANDMPMPMPLPPQDRIFNFGGMHREFMPEAPSGGYSRGGDSAVPQGKINVKEGNLKDQMTTEGSADSSSAEDTEVKPDDKPDKKPHNRRGKGRRHGRRQEQQKTENAN